MTVRHMKIFIAVYQTENMTRAAEALHMTQPAVTRAIQELERYYGVCLFERIGRRLSVTESGRQLYAQALHIVDAFDRMEKGLRNWDEVGVLRLGASVTLGSFLMPALVRDFQAEHPHLKVTVLISNGTQIQQALEDNRLDLAFIEGAVNLPHLHAERFSGDHLVLLLPPGHPLSRQPVLHLADLADHPLLLREPGSAGRNFIDHVFAAHGLQPSPLWESTSTQALVKAVQAGLGISLLPQQLVQADIDAGRVETRALADEAFDRPYQMVWHENKYLTESAKALLASCRLLCGVNGQPGGDA